MLNLMGSQSLRELNGKFVAQVVSSPGKFAARCLTAVLGKESQGTQELFNTLEEARAWIDVQKRDRTWHTQQQEADLLEMYTINRRRISSDPLFEYAHAVPLVLEGSEQTFMSGERIFFDRMGKIIRPQITPFNS